MNLFKIISITLFINLLSISCVAQELSIILENASKLVNQNVRINYDDTLYAENLPFGEELILLEEVSDKYYMIIKEKGCPPVNFCLYYCYELEDYENLWDYQTNGYSQKCW